MTERLYNPWRLKYINSPKRQADQCVFCQILNNPADDPENFVVHRGDHTFSLLNIYPYNPGHVLVLPYEHVPTLVETPAIARQEMMNVATYFTALLTDLMQPDGYNIGVNIGKAAGAGLESHLHLHVVPRWAGDSNFMPVIGETRTLPEEMPATYDKIMRGMQDRPIADWLA